MAASQSVVMVVRAGLPNCCGVISLGGGPCGIFLGKPEKTAAQVQVCAIAGEAAATLGLFAKVERLRHRTHSQRGGSPPLGALSCRRRRIVAGNFWTISILCPVRDSISRSGLSGRGTRLGSGKRYIEPVV